MSIRTLIWPKKTLLLAAFLCSLATQTFAQTPKTPAPKPVKSTFSPATLFSAPQISLRVLPNGVRSIAKQTRGAGVVSVQVWVRAGSRHEEVRQNGAAHLVGVAAVNASREYSLKSGGIGTSLSALGADVQEQTARDATNFAVTVAPQYTADAMRALSDATLRPDLSDAALSIAKTEALNDIALRAGDPVSATSDFAYATAFARHDYRRAALGDEADIQALTSTRVREFHASRYRGGNISVVIVGDISAARAHQLTAQFFGVAPRATLETVTNDNSFAAKNVRRFSSAARITTSLSFRAPGLNAPEDVVATDVLLSYWNEGRDAQMRKILLPQPNATSSTRSAENANEDAPENALPPAPEAAPALGLDIAYLTQRDPSLLSFTFVTEPESSVLAEKTLFSEIARVRKSGLTNAELRRAKTLLSRQYVAQGETASGQAGALGFYDAIGSYTFAVEYLNRIARVSNRDIERVAVRYLQSNRVVRIVVEPSMNAAPPDNSPDNRDDATDEGETDA